MTHSTVLRFNGALLALICLASILTFRALPEHIPMHFGRSGAPDRWAQRSWLAWLALPIVSAALTLLLYALGRWTARRPQTWNVPEKTRFLSLSEQERTPVVNMLLLFLAWVSFAITAFLGIVQLAIFEVATGRAARLPRFFAAGLLCTIAFILIGAFGLNARMRRAILRADARSGTRPDGR